MKTMQEVAIDNGTQITEELSYDTIIQKLNEARDNNIPVEEGIIGALVGGVAGAAFGPTIMKALCKILGVDERGQFGSLLTSRLVTTAIGAAVGWK